MLAARIKFGTPLMAPNSNPSLTFTNNGSTITLKISIDLDPQYVSLVDDTAMTDTSTTDNFRDAKIGVGMLTRLNLKQLEISLIDATEGGSNFNIHAILGTKIPGTGLGFVEFIESL